MNTATNNDDALGENVDLKNCIVLINELAGGVSQAAEHLEGLPAFLTEAGFNVHYQRVHPEVMAAKVQEQLAQEPTLVVIGGGDGTLRAVAAVLVDTPHVIGILPLGTLNRFAQALHIPLDIEDAIQVLIHGDQRRVDVGEAGGQIFLNTCVLGLYPELARRREERRSRHRRWPKLIRWLWDTLTATWEVWRSWRLIRFRLRLDGRKFAEKVPLLVVTNNPMPSLVERGSLAEGTLGIYIPRVKRPLHFLWLAMRSLMKGPMGIEPLEILVARDVVIDMIPRNFVALDGEVAAMMSGSLHLRCRPGACRVRVPVAVRGS